MPYANQILSRSVSPFFAALDDDRDDYPLDIPTPPPSRVFPPPPPLPAEFPPHVQPARSMPDAIRRILPELESADTPAPALRSLRRVASVFFSATRRPSNWVRLWSHPGVEANNARARGYAFDLCLDPDGRVKLVIGYGQDDIDIYCVEVRADA